MKIGIPRESKNHEYRVGLTPGAVREALAHGHDVIVETGAGHGIGASDSDYERAGARIALNVDEVFGEVEMIVKVKEPLAAERARLRPHHLLFTYLHLAPDPGQAEDLLASGATAIAYETVTAPGGGLPLLAPMSEVAGRMSIQAGAAALEKSHGGRGVLLGGVPGVEPGRVVVIGGGTVGNAAARTALGMGADVTVLDRSLAVLRHLDDVYRGHLKTIHATRDAIERHVLQADLVIGAVLIPGAAAPKLVSRAMLNAMKPGAVIVDVAIDQGGCVETSRITSHKQPTFEVHDVIHYCVPNIASRVPATASAAVSNILGPLLLKAGDMGGMEQLMKINEGVKHGVYVYRRHLTKRPMASIFGIEFMDINLLVASTL